jgi:AcrR family transcriptional regulator
MSPRPYQSPRRTAGATKTREQVVKSAAAILSSSEGIGGFSLEAVARKAGVTRLTVYNHFGSRRALLEAVFDRTAMLGGLHRIGEVMAGGSDPHSALQRIVEIFCDFWSFAPTTIGLLHSAGASDPEFETSVRERNERRRQILLDLVNRLAAGRDINSQEIDNIVDVLFALTSFHFFAQLTAGKRSATEACELIRRLVMDAVKPVAS